MKSGRTQVEIIALYEELGSYRAVGGAGSPCSPCLLHLATLDLTVRRYDTDGRRSGEHRGCEEACAQRSTSAGEIVQRGRQSRRVIGSVDPVGHIVGPDVDA